VIVEVLAANRQLLPSLATPIVPVIPPLAVMVVVVDTPERSPHVLSNPLTPDRSGISSE
jgi:hypothetical protein